MEFIWDLIEQIADFIGGCIECAFYLLISAGLLWLFMLSMAGVVWFCQKIL